MAKWLTLAAFPWVLLSCMLVFGFDGWQATPGPTDKAPRMSPEDLFAELQRQASIVSSEWPDDKIADALPEPKTEASEVHDSVIAGKVIAVEPGAAYVNRGDSVRASRVSFDSDEAHWRVFRVTIEPEWTLEAEGPTSVFWLVVSAQTSEADVRSGLIGTDVIALLKQPGWFEFDRTLPNIGHSGELLGRVSPDGSLSFPVMTSETHEEEYLGGLDTLQELKTHVEQSE